MNVWPGQFISAAVPAPNRTSSNGTRPWQSGSPSLTARRNLARLSGFLGAALALTPSVQGQTLYALVQGSEWHPAGDAPTVPLRGSFRLVSRPGPPDWEVFAVERVILETRPEAGQPLVWRGSGRYQRGRRGPFFAEQMWLDLDGGRGSVRFVSGLQPVRSAQDLDLVLQADTADGSALHLKAVPELCRWRYRTMADTRLVNACAICVQRVIPVPLQGGFDLVHSGGNPLFERYYVFNLHLTDGAPLPGVEVTGEGTVEIGGEVAVQQRWDLVLRVRPAGDGVRVARLTNAVTAPLRRWPMLGVDLEEDGGDDFSRFFLSLRAAPFRELWFTTHSGMTPGVGSWPESRLTGADLLSDTGRLVVPQARLLKAAGLPPEAGVDGFDVIPGSGGAVAFSIGQAADSPVLGSVSEGDLLSSDGRVLRRNEELLARLGFMPPPPELGLDAVFLHESGEYWFSVREAAWSETLGRMIGPGDLLSDVGRVVRGHAELLAAFKLEDPERDYGLDAFFAWPSGEIWFSVEAGFTDGELGVVTDGDLLSDQGYVVARNLDLVGPFQPLEDLANFGLQGLWVVSDALAVTGPPKLNQPRLTPAGLELTWQGPGRVFQVEAAGRLDDPFAPLSPLLPSAAWTVTREPAASGSFYRLRSW